MSVWIGGEQVDGPDPRVVGWHYPPTRVDELEDDTLEAAKDDRPEDTPERPWRWQR